MKIRIKRFDKSLPLPDFAETNPATRQKYPADQVAAFDFFCGESQTIAPHSIGIVPLNAAVAVPPGYLLLLAARSSTPWKKGLMLANGVGIVDPFYSGDRDELAAQLLNFTDRPVTVEKGERLVQGVLLRRETVEWQEVKHMGAAGHGGYVTTGDGSDKDAA